MSEDQEFARLARNIKIKKWLLTFVMVFCTIILVALFAYKIDAALTRRQHDRLDRRMQIEYQLMSPNIEISDRYISEAGAFAGGKLISHRYKEIDGYRIPWSPQEGKYTFWSEEILMGDMIDFAGDQAYDRQTQTKIPIFYNKYAKLKPGRIFPVKKVNEIGQVAKMKGYVAEVALTFKEPLTYEEINRKLPDKIKGNWYWFGMGTSKELCAYNNQYLGFQVNRHNRLKGDYRDGVEMIKSNPKVNLGEFNSFSYSDYLKNYFKKYPTIDKAKFAGVIITGKSENFAPLVGASWIYASSVGATIKTVPYIEPKY
ncbi:anti sigma factor C-terminal domain-containing protein [Xylocopilactobacillus apicola]|uniref:Sigma factor regulator C-terminal domain-containing protein n=1 Tax=Xylocopilactobacillus apicola TaxID=2932184 RepID=A0AAU9D053_9LACO|nr:anti sigma factor C-terminal domain-containing protein [Xylocopilactobacillus apicola]BDR59639.1 hypothetical protein XA3_20800 [Xylocopilactobacillus apicola]